MENVFVVIYRRYHRMTNGRLYHNPTTALVQGAYTNLDEANKAAREEAELQAQLYGSVNDNLFIEQSYPDITRYVVLDRQRPICVYDVIQTWLYTKK